GGRRSVQPVPARRARLKLWRQCPSPETHGARVESSSITPRLGQEPPIRLMNEASMAQAPGKINNPLGFGNVSSGQSAIKMIRPLVAGGFTQPGQFFRKFLKISSDGRVVRAAACI